MDIGGRAGICGSPTDEFDETRARGAEERDDGERLARPLGPPSFRRSRVRDKRRREPWEGRQTDTSPGGRLIAALAFREASSACHRSHMAAVFAVSAQRHGKRLSHGEDRVWCDNNSREEAAHAAEAYARESDLTFLLART